MQICEQGGLKAARHSSFGDVSGHLRDLRGGAIVGLVFKGIAFAGAILFSIVVARSLGANAAGQFFLAMTLVTMASTIARVGLDKPIVRFVAIARTSGNGIAITALIATSFLLVAGISIATGALMYAASDWLAGTVFSKPSLNEHLSVLALSVPAVATTGVISAGFQGLSRVALYLLFLSVLTPLVALAGIAVCSQLDLNVSVALVYTIASIITLSMAAVAWLGVAGAPKRAMPIRELSSVIASSRANLVVIVAQLMMSWMPAIVLGLLSTSEDVATYFVADRLALLISFALIAVNSIAAPKFASLHGTGELDALRMSVLKTTQMATLSALPVVLVFVIWPEVSLLAVGNEFRQTGELLRILAIGYFATTATGSVSSLLLMSGFEREFRNVCVMGAIVSMVVTPVGVMALGARGAAWAMTVTLLLISIASAEVARRRLGFSGIGWLVPGHARRTH